MNYSLSKKKAKELVEAKLSHFMGVSPEEATNEQFYKAIALILREMMGEGRAEFNKLAANEGTKKVYYLCMEFLMGRSLKNNLYNLNLTKTFESVLADYGIKLDSIKTKDFRAFLNAVQADGKALVVTPAKDEIVIKSARNIPGVQVSMANLINVYDILKAKYLVLDKEALAVIEEVFA